MVDRRRCPTLVLVALLATPALPGLAQEGSPCDGGGGVLIRDWEVDGLPGTEGRPARATLECLDDGRIRQVVEVSRDQGRSWTRLFESIYAPLADGVPATDAAPAADAVPADAPPADAPPTDTPRADAPRDVASGDAAPAETAGAAAQEPVQPQAARQASVEGSEVQAVSRELEREEIPREEAPELVMASPMVLEVVPGKIDAYPEGTAWSTDETAGFICSQVVIKKVTVGRERDGGNTNLVVGAQLFTKKRQRRLDLKVEALLDGEVVASTTLERVRIGLNIPGHDKHGMMVTDTLELSSEQFERMFGGGAEPKLRLTLTVDSG